MTQMNFAEPPLVSDKLLYAWMLDIHNKVQGIGQDSIGGSLDVADLPATTPISDVDETITGAWTFDSDATINGNLTINGHLYVNDNFTIVTNPVLLPSSYDVLDTDKHIYVDPVSWDMTINLPTATGSGRIITVQKLTNTADVIVNGRTLTTLLEFVILQDIDTGTWVEKYGSGA